MIRVVLADDHHLVRQALRALLGRLDDIEVVGEAGDGQEAVRQVQRLLPDVLVTDLAMPLLNGTQVAERICDLGLTTRVVILSIYSRGTLVREALRRGVVGYVLKRSVTEELLLAVRAAHRGDIYLSPTISRSVVGPLLRPRSVGEASDFAQLTRREREVLQLIAEGHTNRSIAEALSVSIKTVENHRAHLMSKLGIHDVAGLTRVAIKHGLVFLDD